MGGISVESWAESTKNRRHGVLQHGGLRIVERRGQMFLRRLSAPKRHKKIYTSISATELPRAKVGMT